MWSGLGDSEVAPVSQRVQLKIEEVDVETQRLSRRNDHVLLRVQIEPGRGNRQIVSAGRQLRDRVAPLLRAGCEDFTWSSWA